MIQTTFRTKKSAQTFETVLQAATELFRSKGFHGTTMRDLSRASGLGLGALYYYFDSKEALVLRFYELNSRQTLEAYRALPDLPENLADTVARFLRLKLEDLTPYRDLIRIVMKEAIDPESPLCPLNPTSAAVLADNLALYRELVERSRTAKGQEAQEWAQGLWMVQMAILTYWLHDRSPEFEATQRAIEILKTAVRLSHVVARVPGLGALRRQILALVANLFPAYAPPSDSGNQESAS
ncbi:MAG TPA: TetR family transcriptional regulator [Chthonomonadaceae bacterium]|nr:TetR family transcriptional regulator [Chthonomonadaceae bacterium]